MIINLFFSFTKATHDNFYLFIYLINLYTYNKKKTIQIAKSFIINFDKFQDLIRLSFITIYYFLIF